MNVSCLTYSLFAASFLFINTSAQASGRVKAVAGVYDFVLSFDTQDATNAIGTEIDKTWQVGAIPSGQWFIRCTSLDKSNNRGIPILYSAGFISPLVHTTGNWYSLDEHWDVSVKVYIAGKVMKYIPVPFDAVSNQNQNTYTQCLSLGDNYIRTSTLGTGKQGIFSLKLKKKIVNGYSFISSPIIYVAGATAASDIDINDPFARVIIDSFSINLPEKCEINAGQSIDIDFGDVATTKLDGNHYREKKTLTVSCSGGEFDSGLDSVSAQFIGAASPFSSDYFSSTHNGIGILLKDEADNAIKPQGERKINMVSGKGSLPLSFTPVAESRSIDAGEFTASIIVKLLLE
ncbi:fimbrial protein [Enterobacteriaceae bacterium 4M9]|nr:fimbrial protein [Enterobacteriaceae bacterium 4M9]